MSDTSRVRYRIVSLPPGESQWRWLPFTGASGGDYDTLVRRIVTAVAESPDGWRFKIEARHERVITGEWRHVTAEQEPVAPEVDT